MSSASESEGSYHTLVLTLLFFWIILVLLLFFLYKRLNRDTNGQYTVHRLIYSPGGLRDRVMQGIDVVRGFVERVRPQNHDEEEAINDHESENGDGEEEEGDMDGGCQNETNEDEDDQGKDDSSDDYSSIDLRERVMQNNSTEEVVEKKQEEKQKDDKKEDEHKQEEEEKLVEGVDLLVNTKPFSGSAIWSEEKTDDSVTAL